MDDETRVAEPDAPTVENAARALFEDPSVTPEYIWAEMVREDPTRADIWREDARRVLLASGLLDRLRAAEAERDTIQRRTEEREAKRYRSAIGNWKNIAQTAEARAAEAEAVIAKAPHAQGCAAPPRWPDYKPVECTCWKSLYRAGTDHE